MPKVLLLCLVKVAIVVSRCVKHDPYCVPLQAIAIMGNMPSGYLALPGKPVQYGYDAKHSLGCMNNALIVLKMSSAPQ